MGFRSSIHGTPASEHSVYFDAPMPHDDGDTVVGSRAPSVMIPKKPVVNTQPQPGPRAVYGDEDDIEEEQGGGSSEDEDEDRVLQPGPDPFEDRRGTSRFRDRKQRASISGFSYTNGKSIPSASSRRAKSVPRAGSPSEESFGTAPTSVESAPVGSMKKSALKKRASIRSGAFSAGPGTIGPSVSSGADLQMSTRERTAESVLTPKQKSKIAKEELKEGKRLSKIIQTEQKAERQALEMAMKELAELTKLQKTAMKDESRAHTAHATTLKSFHKTELAYLAARAKYESALTDLKNAEEGLEKSRRHAEMVTDLVREKMNEVEELRGMKRVDDRERMVKVSELRGKMPGSVSESA